MTKAAKRTYGLLIETVERYGTTKVVARLVRREAGEDHPLGCRSEGETGIWDSPPHLEGLALDGLELSGFVTDIGRGDFRFVGAREPEYSIIYAINLALSKRQYKTLQKIEKRILADKAVEPGDCFYSFAQALKLDFVVTKIPDTGFGSSFADHRWVFWTIGEGRNIFRNFIDAAVAAKKATAA